MEKNSALKIEKKIEETYEDWIKKIYDASRPNLREEHTRDHVQESQKIKGEESQIKSSKKRWILPGFVFILALASRFYFAFFIINPQNGAYGWYNDIYHHWLIGFFTRDVGLSHGFLRLWDLKGMEYFWGPLHPLVLSLLFTITGSTSIIIPKLLSIVSGSGAIVVLFLLAKRYFNLQVAIATAFLAVFNPIGIFTDVSGMQEPLGILLLFLALYFWPKQSLLAGFLFGIVSMARAEYWLFSAGLVFTLIVFSKEHIDKKMACAFAYIVPIIFYMKYLLNYTNNAIYPIWWNFLGNAKGEWQPDIPLNDEQVFIRYIFGVILAVSILGMLIILKKRPKWFLLSLLGLGNLAFLAFFIGFTDYILSYLPRFWLDRIFWLPYLFIGFIVAVLIFSSLKRILPMFSKMYFNWILWLFLGVIILVLQILWIPIWRYYQPERWSFVLERREMAAKEALSSYNGGSILVPEDDQVFVYYLVKNSNISGKNLIGQMFDPFYYMNGDPFAKWGKNRKVILDWLKKEDIRLIFLKPETLRYKKMVSLEKDHFKYIKTITNGVNLMIYEVVN